MSRRTQIWVSYAEEARRWADWIAAQWSREAYDFILQQRRLTDHLGTLKDIRCALEHFDRVIVIASPNYADFIALREWPEISDVASLAVVKVFATYEMTTPFPSLTLDAVELSEELLAARLGKWLQETDFRTSRFDSTDQLRRAKQGVFPRIWRVPFAFRTAAANGSHSPADLWAILRAHRRIVFPTAADISARDIAIRYAYEYGSNYQVVVFVNCHNEIQICTDFAALTGALGLSQARYFDQPFLIAEVKRWFELNGAWLLVFHDVPANMNVQQYEPSSHSGHIIIVPAHRLNSVVEAARPQLRAPHHPANGVEAGYRRKTPENEPKQIDCGEQLYDQSIVEVDKGSGCGALQRLESEIMCIMSWLGPEVLPYYTWENEAGSFRQRAEALSALARAGYVELTTEGTRVTPALQSLLQARQSVCERQHYIEQALSLLVRNLPRRAQDYRNWPKYAGLATHILYTTQQAREHQIGSDSCVRLLNQLAIYQLQRFHRERAVKLMRTALAIAVDAYGSEHELVSLCYNNLGATLNELGEHGPALDCFTKALAVDTILYGSNSTRVATRLSNISQTLFTLGRTEEAIHFGRKAIAGDPARQTAQGTRAPGRFLNLSQLLAQAGDLGEATSLAQRAVDAAKTIYGSEHPQVAYYSTKLAELMELQNRLPEAERLLTKALAINIAYYGNAHWKYHSSAEVLSRVRTALSSREEVYSDKRG